jgi:hypothetical protein
MADFLKYIIGNPATAQHAPMPSWLQNAWPSPPPPPPLGGMSFEDYMNSFAPPSPSKPTGPVTYASPRRYPVAAGPAGAVPPPPPPLGGMSFEDYMNSFGTPSPSGPIQGPMPAMGDPYNSFKNYMEELNGPPRTGPTGPVTYASSGLYPFPAGPAIPMGPAPLGDTGFSSSLPSGGYPSPPGPEILGDTGFSSSLPSGGYPSPPGPAIPMGPPPPLGGMSFEEYMNSFAPPSLSKPTGPVTYASSRRYPFLPGPAIPMGPAPLGDTGFSSSLPSGGYPSPPGPAIPMGPSSLETGVSSLSKSSMEAPMAAEGGAAGMAFPRMSPNAMLGAAFAPELLAPLRSYLQGKVDKEGMAGGFGLEAMLALMGMGLFKGANKMANNLGRLPFVGDRLGALNTGVRSAVTGALETPLAELPGIGGRLAGLGGGVGATSLGAAGAGALGGLYLGNEATKDDGALAATNAYLDEMAKSQGALRFVNPYYQDINALGALRGAAVNHPYLARTAGAALGALNPGAALAAAGTAGLSKNLLEPLVANMTSGERGDTLKPVIGTPGHEREAFVKNIIEGLKGANADLRSGNKAKYKQDISNMWKNLERQGIDDNMIRRLVEDAFRERGITEGLPGYKDEDSGQRGYWGNKTSLSGDSFSGASAKNSEDGKYSNSVDLNRYRRS